MPRLPHKDDLPGLIEGARAGEKFALARLISCIEARPEKELWQTWGPAGSGLDRVEQSHRELVFTALERGSHQPVAKTIGLTGTPGAGKSSLLAALARLFLEKEQAKTLAIVAVDPSSNISGGSLLGDRTRLKIPARERRIFFRSQPSQLELGGVNPVTWHVIRLLRYFFDYVFIETVGIGQNEIEVSNISDFSFLVLQPLGGDQIQFMKSGIMEAPDAFIINKCDQAELARTSYHALETTLDFLKDFRPPAPTETGPPAAKQAPSIFQVSALTGMGLEELWQYIREIPEGSTRDRETRRQLEKWIRAEFGQMGWHFYPDFSYSDGESFENLTRLFTRYLREQLEELLTPN